MSFPQGDGAGLRLVYDRKRDAERMDRARSRQARQAVLDLALPEVVRSQVLDAIDAGTVSESKWRYVMLGIEENLAVMRFLQEKARRPSVAMVLWADILASLRWDTGEVVDSRKVLAERANVEARYVSEIMSLLEGVGVMRRERDGRGVRYFLNSNVGTHLTGALRDRVQEVQRAPLLDLMLGGKANA